MGKARQFAQNSFWLIVSSGSILLVGAVYRPILGRILGPVGLGQYTFIQAFINYFLVLAYFGVRRVIIREIGRNPETARAYLLAAYKLRAVTTLFAMAACCAVGYALQRSPQVTLGIVVLSLSIAAMATSDLLESVLVARQRSLYVAVANTIGNALKLGVGVWALSAGYGLIGVLWVFVGTSAATAAMNWVFVSLVIRSERQSDAGPGRVRFIISEAWPFLILDTATRLYAKSDILILSLMRGDLVTGLYGAAYVFIDVLLTVDTSCALAAYPMIARLYGDEERERDKTGLAEAYERLHKHMLMVSLAAGALLMSIGGDLLVWIFGPEYAGASPLFAVLAWVPAIDISIVVSGIFLSAMYRQRLVAGIEVAMMTSTVALTLWLVYLYNSMGAAVATVGAAAVSAVVRHLYVRKHLGHISPVSTWVKPLACAVIVAAAAVSVSHTAWSWRLVVLVASCAVAVAVVRPYDAEDRRLIRSVLRRG